MGVPALFRWLSAKYPKIVSSVKEKECETNIDGISVPVNPVDPNPNGEEFDNLYLDMNGIIHPCTHPMDKPAPATEEEMMVEIFKYIDRIFSMVRPRKLLFMAIDGVAPRAKMNQQRSRRFRAAQEREEKEANELAEKDDGDQTVTETEDDILSSDTSFDSNCITPGTEFMELVAKSVRYYAVQRLSSFPGWEDVKVIFSDANVPGEGEHKIVDYIRRQRLDPGYDANTKHVIYGLDADLIMLSMATHEPHFKVLREDVFYEERRKYSPCTYCGEKGHTPDSCPKHAAEDPTFKMAFPEGSGKPFIFLDVAILREYLKAELEPKDPLPFKWCLERAIDDWIFLCFFVGNDFLPHLPCLEIREGAIDLLIDIYKRNQVQMQGFITCNGNVDLDRTQMILNDIADIENKIFQKRHEKEERKQYNIKKRQAEATRMEQLEAASITMDNKQAALAIKAEIALHPPTTETAAKQSSSTPTPDDTPAAKLWESGAKEAYYDEKFGADQVKDPSFIPSIVKGYVEGLCWVMAYYYQGCPSWKWYYPFHYAPFTSSMTNIKDYKPHFQKGQPFRPFDQLMGVFPAASQTLIPFPFRKLMTEEASPIIDFYPTDFAVDLNGKKHAWQGVILLPFIDEARLLGALHSVYDQVDEKEMQRNELGSDRLFLRRNEKSKHLSNMLECDKHCFPIDTFFTDGLAGFVQKDADTLCKDDGGNLLYPSPIPNHCPNIMNPSICSFIYKYPYHYASNLVHKSDLLSSAAPPPRTLSSEDVYQVKSGLASKRVPGRLVLESRGPRENYGSHSMHREYAQSYDRKDYHPHRSSADRKNAAPPDSNVRAARHSSSHQQYHHRGHEDRSSNRDRYVKHSDRPAMNRFDSLMPPPPPPKSSRTSSYSKYPPPPK